MKKWFVIICLFSAGLLSAKSLWNNGLSLYQVKVAKGDIVKIRFSEKTLMKYKVEQRQSSYQATKGRKGGGSLFSFFPDAEVNQNDTIRNQNNLNVNNENKFVVPALITDIEDRTVMISGNNSTMVNGEAFKVQFDGQFDIRSLNADLTIFSTEIYNLNFRVLNESPTNAALFSANDLIFTTNYNEMLTNKVIDTNTNLTNEVITTNFSSIKIEFKGIADEKKQDLIVRYLNTIINALFR